MKSTFEDELMKHGYIVYTNKGVSMLPLLRENKDVMVIEKKEEGQLKNHDVVLFKRKNGQYVLHRILEVRSDDYWIVGDNCIYGEYVKEEQIIGVLKSVVRDGKKISVDCLNYRIYVWIWCLLFPVRIRYKKVKSIIRSIIKK